MAAAKEEKAVAVMKQAGWQEEAESMRKRKRRKAEWMVARWIMARWGVAVAAAAGLAEEAVEEMTEDAG